MRRSIVSIRRVIHAGVAMSIILLSGVSHADIVKDGFVFDDDAFVDELVGAGATLQPLRVGAGTGTVVANITDNSLGTAVRLRTALAFMDLAFTDNVAVNGLGTDIVIFEWFSGEGFDVTINAITKSVTGGPIFSEDGINQNASEIDLSDFGIAAGGTVSELRVSRTAAVPQSPAISGVAALSSNGPLLIDLDIKPGSDVNPINPLAQGVIPVAILGTDTFDVLDVDEMTLAFGPAGAVPVHDLSDPATYAGHLKDEAPNDDGFTDLISHYRTAETGIAFGDFEACVTGETLDAESFEGCDSIETIPPGCGIGFELALLLPPLMWVYRRRRRPIH